MVLGDQMGRSRNLWLYPISSGFLQKAGAGVAMAAATTGLLVAIGTDRDKQNDVIVVRSQADANVVAAIRDLRSQTAQLRRDQEQIRDAANGNGPKVQLSDLSLRLERLEARQVRLEQAILTTPEKALAMPLLRRDLDAAKDANTQALASIKANVDQVYDLTKWFIGALAVGIFSLAIPSLLSRRGGGNDPTS